MKVVVSFAVGLLFAIGLGISGMTLPAKIFGFLDFTGGWDPTLAFVMIGAVSVSGVFFWLLRGEKPYLAPTFSLPTRKDIDSKLLVGSALFGVGWGLGGFCPGPALTSLASGAQPALVFVGAMAVGMSAHELFKRLQS
jgi:uncharacterized membrane protein YedE/YeeE